MHPHFKGQVWKYPIMLTTLTIDLINKLTYRGVLMKIFRPFNFLVNIMGTVRVGLREQTFYFSLQFKNSSNNLNKHLFNKFRILINKVIFINRWIYNNKAINILNNSNNQYFKIKWLARLKDKIKFSHLYQVTLKWINKTRARSNNSKCIKVRKILWVNLILRNSRITNNRMGDSKIINFHLLY